MNFWNKKSELDKLYEKYQKAIKKANEAWEDADRINQRIILFKTIQKEMKNDE